jgi:hypothetical protein
MDFASVWISRDEATGGLRIARSSHGSRKECFIQCRQPVALGCRPLIVIALKEISPVEFQRFRIHGGVILTCNGREPLRVDQGISSPTHDGVVGKDQFFCRQGHRSQAPPNRREQR